MIAVSSEHYPFVLLDIGRGPRPEEAYRRAFEAIHEINVRARPAGTRHVMIAAGRNHPDARERKILAELSNGLAPWETALCVVSVVVIPNPLMRGALTALRWLIPRMAPVDGAATSDRAVELAEEYLRKHEIPFRADSPAAAAKWLRQQQGAVSASRHP
jgi:hypothetical protein